MTKQRAQRTMRPPREQANDRSGMRQGQRASRGLSGIAKAGPDAVALSALQDSADGSPVVQHFERLQRLSNAPAAPHLGAAPANPAPNSGIQAKLKIGSPGDRFEREADRVADQVMRMPAPSIQRSCSCGGTCPKCRSRGEGNRKALVQRQQAKGSREAVIPPGLHEGLRSLIQTKRSDDAVQRQEDEDEEKLIQTKEAPGAGPALTASTQSAISGLRGGGAPLPASERAFFEPRFGRDFSQVRVHTDARAAEAARAISARAFTYGNDIAFGAGQFQPNSGDGQRLLAHELTHTVQQSKTGVSAVQRRLTVNKNAPSFAPANDPANTLTQAQRLSEMDTLVQALCDNFEVDQSTGEVEEKSPQCDDPGTVATGSNPTGCCCLCVMTNPAGNSWTIEVSQVLGPHTRPGSRQVIISPSTSPIEFGAFTGTNTLAIQGSVPTLGHELCGHAALIELNAHPAGADRTRTDVHDPTVKIENLISGEQGVPASDLRGLAASGTHRGESVDRISVHYGFNQTQVSSLPAAEISKFNFAADYINANQTWVDLLGHSDAVGSTTAKMDVSQRRANNMKTALNGRGVANTITKTFGPPGASSTISGNRFTRVEGRSDFDLIPGAPAAEQRRVEILMAGFPAGAQNPIPGTPTATASVGPQSPLAAFGRFLFGNECERRLIGAAWL